MIYKVSKGYLWVISIEGDHCKYVNEFTNAGIKVYSNKQVVDDFGGESYNLRIVEEKKQFKVGEFTIIPFAVRHDVSLINFNYLIKHPESGTIVFLTDLVYSKYLFPSVNNWLIEANYCEDMVKSGDGFLSQRIINSHLSVQNCIKLLTANNLGATNNIVLLHLSNSNSNAKQFKQKVTDATGKMVNIAEPNLILDFNKNPF